MSDQERTSSSGSRQPGGSGPATTPGGSGGDSATGTGAPPGAGGSGGQPVAPAPTRSKPVAGGREPGAAGAREDSEAGGAVGVDRESRAGGESAGRKRGDYPADAGSVGDVKVAEDILGSVLGDREPDESEPPRRNPP